jgi:hypothetical protein
MEPLIDKLLRFCSAGHARFDPQTLTAYLLMGVEVKILVFGTFLVWLLISLLAFFRKGE